MHQRVRVGNVDPFPFCCRDWLSNRAGVHRHDSFEYDGNAQAGGALILQYYGQIMACYFLYFLAIIVVTSYLYVALRNLFLNNLSLANDSIRFHSSVTAHGMLWRLLVVFVISGVTLGLAYPWLKIWLVSWLAQEIHRSGRSGFA